ncbi:MAG: hypothetical protein M3N29_03555 [Chloroflexota bacterium]|nr:hypothetical protein [Chloroflexota bacterium]
MAYALQSLDELQVEHGRIVRVSRLVSKPGQQHALVEAVERAARQAVGPESVFVGFHFAGDRSVVSIITQWQGPDALRSTDNARAPLLFETYSNLVDSWSWEYFQELVETRKTAARSG